MSIKLSKVKMSLSSLKIVVWESRDLLVLCSNYVEEASSEMSCSQAFSLIISRLENTSYVPNTLESWKLYGKLACVCIVHFLNTEFIALVRFSNRFIHSVSIYWEPTMCQVYRKEWDKDHTVWSLQSTVGEQQMNRISTIWEMLL